MSTATIPVLKNYPRESPIVYDDVKKNPKSSVKEISKRTGIGGAIVTDIVRFYCGDDEWGAMDCYFVKGEPRYSILKKIQVSDSVNMDGEKVMCIIDESMIPPRKNNGYKARIRKLLRIRAADI